MTLDLVTRQPDPDDQRIILIEMTDKGREQLALLNSLDGGFERAYAEIEEDAGPVFDRIGRAIMSLRLHPLAERMVT